MTPKENQIVEKLKAGKSHILASSRITLLWWSITFLSVSFLVISGALLNAHFTGGTELNLAIPAALIIIALVLSYLAFKVNSLEITATTFIVRGRFQKVIFNHEDLKKANCFSIALKDPLKIAFYTSIQFNQKNTVKTYYILNTSKLSDDFVEYPDLLLRRIKNTKP
ncbi:hypothetical protein [Croceiramulus getboli]|nr:hypothetical protein P8624_06615 [Flavobacteriaceae bacterium YJPT1-3]